MHWLSALECLTPNMFSVQVEMPVHRVAEKRLQSLPMHSLFDKLLEAVEQSMLVVCFVESVVVLPINFDLILASRPKLKFHFKNQVKVSIIVSKKSTILLLQTRLSLML